MHASTALLLAIAGSAAAQLTSTTSAATSVATAESGCGSSVDLIIADCLQSTGLQLQACGTNDWDCMCTQQTNVLTCYNNCMSDPARAGAVSQQTSWCSAAHPFGTTTTTAAATTQTSSSDAMSSGTPTSVDAEASPSASSSGDEPESSATDNAAVANVVPGALAAFLGLAVLL